MAVLPSSGEDGAVIFAGVRDGAQGKGGIVKKTVIIADDLTGALDVAAPFAAPKVSVRVLLEGGTTAVAKAAVENDDVLSVCVETRHLDAGAAKDAVRAAFDRFGDGASILFKKTDSALRGNIGAELEALLEASAARMVHFIPAFPAMGRTTNAGIHFIDGVPVAESAFGDDPLNPVACSRVADVIAATSMVPVLEVSAGAPLPADFSGIAVYDATTQGEVDARVREILQTPGPLALAGCAGLARSLAVAQGIQATHGVAGCAGDLLVMCGSGNPASRAQCAAARAVAPSLKVPVEAMIDSEWIDGSRACAFERELQNALDAARPLALVDASSPVPATVAAELAMPDEDLRARISSQLGALFARLICGLRPSAALIVGGDALLACLRVLGVAELVPFAEPAPGVVAAFVHVGGRKMVLASKSGGFGAPELFLELAECLTGRPPGSS